VANQFAAGKIAIAECDVCGFVYKRRELKALVVKGKNTNVQACPTCWNPDHPQLHIGEVPINDPQGLRNPRPDYAGYPESRAQIVMVRGVVSRVYIGRVTASGS